MSDPLRITALNLAVESRPTASTSEEIVDRAEAFFAFLNASAPDDANGNVPFANVPPADYAHFHGHDHGEAS